VPKNAVEAAKWYRKAADLGNPIAQYHLASAYAKGEGLTESHSEAVKWYQRSARQGFAESQYMLGMITHAGRGMEPDPIEGLKWILVAIAQGHEKAELIRPQLEERMSPEQIKESAVLAKKFVPNTEPD
jgi:TPR repeat protein